MRKKRLASHRGASCDSPARPRSYNGRPGHARSICVSAPHRELTGGRSTVLRTRSFVAERHPSAVVAVAVRLAFRHVHHPRGRRSGADELQLMLNDPSTDRTPGPIEARWRKATPWCDASRCRTPPTRSIRCCAHGCNLVVSSPASRCRVYGDRAEEGHPPPRDGSEASCQLAAACSSFI